MAKKLMLFLTFASFSFGCVGRDQNVQNNQNLQNVPVIEKTEKDKTKFLFDAVDLLGRKPVQIDKILGKPYLITGESRSNPSGKSRWQWYKYEKDLSVFIDRDSKDEIATSITLIFKSDPKDVIEAAKMLGINLDEQKPTKVREYDDWKEESYELNVKGKNIVVYFFQDSKDEDTIKVSFNE